MESIVQHYIVDMSSNNNFVQIPSVQGDGNGVRTVELELYQNGVPYQVPTDVVISVAGTKPDTKQVMDLCTVNDKGYVCFDITSQMSAIEGRGDYQIMFIDTETKAQLKSFPFVLITTKAAYNAKALTSTDEFELLTQTIATALANYDYVMQRAQASADESHGYANESKASAEEANRIKDETNQIKNETNQIKNDTDAIKSATEGIKNATAQLKDDVIQLKADTNQIKNETDQIKTDTEAVRDTAIQAKDDAVIYAANAEQSKDDSLSYANLSKSYAIGTDGQVRQDDNQDNSKYYYEKTREIAQGLVGTLRPKGSVLFEEIALLTEIEAGDMYNIKNDFVTTSDFREGAGISMPSGTNIFYTVDGQWDCLAGTSVMGIKGEKEESYRVGNVNITRQNIGSYIVTSAVEPTDQYIGEVWYQEY